jgi:mRNA interferase RelE/StbE
VRYRLELAEDALRALRRLHEPVRSRMAQAINHLTDDPYPSASKTLHGGYEGYRRVRVGDYRAIYSVDEASRVVAVARIAHRSSVYKG